MAIACASHQKLLANMKAAKKHELRCGFTHEAQH